MRNYVRLTVSIFVEYVVNFNFFWFQDEAKKASAPWFLAKSFDTSCPIGDFVSKEKIPGWLLNLDSLFSFTSGY